MKHTMLCSVAEFANRNKADYEQKEKAFGLLKVDESIGKGQFRNTDYMSNMP